MRRQTFDRVKRAVDVVVAIPLFVVSLPVQAVVGAAVAARLGRPVIFRQTRPGRDGKPFDLIKFRTMRPYDADSGLADDASRLTGLGRVLRASSLDELPTLLNVIRGDMSLVGPRPLLMEYLDRYTPEQARRHEVRPGITGLAQVAGRNRIDWDERLRLDVEYVDRRCFKLDLRILASTVTTVVHAVGISNPGHATMPEFTGSEGSRP